MFASAIANRSFQPVSPVQLRFSGEAEYQKYLAQLRGFDGDAIERLAQIKRNEKNEGPKHIALAVWHGFRSDFIDTLNDEIRRLLKVRNRNKTSDPAVSAQGKEHLGDLRHAIETVLCEHGYDKTGNKLDTVA